MTEMGGERPRRESPEQVLRWQEESPEAWRNQAVCKDCAFSWFGPPALVEGAFHEVVTQHKVICTVTLS